MSNSPLFTSSLKSAGKITHSDGLIWDLLNSHWVSFRHVTVVSYNDVKVKGKEAAIAVGQTNLNMEIPRIVGFPAELEGEKYMLNGTVFDSMGTGRRSVLTLLFYR